jgi:DNA polymerase III subunit chi
VRVDFYQLSRDPAEALVAQLAERTLAAGERLLVVTADPEQGQRISEALWAYKPEAFLAHGVAGAGHEPRQPILIAQAAEPANGARYVAFADGTWRDPPSGCERAFLLFGEATIAAARERWKSLPPGERHFWRQGERGWDKVA